MRKHNIGHNGTILGGAGTWELEHLICFNLEGHARHMGSFALLIEVQTAKTSSK